MKLKDLCDESPAFKKTIQELVLSGRIYQIPPSTPVEIDAKNGAAIYEEQTRRQRD